VVIDAAPPGARQGRCAADRLPPGGRDRSIQSSGMFVSDLRHFLDLPDDAPGPARKMAKQLGNVVRAATAAEAGTAWVSALPCRRRLGRRPCPGRIIVFRPDLPARIEWAVPAAATRA